MDVFIVFLIMMIVAGVIIVYNLVNFDGGGNLIALIIGTLIAFSACNYIIENFGFWGWVIAIITVGIPLILLVLFLIKIINVKKLQIRIKNSAVEFIQKAGAADLQEINDYCKKNIPGLTNTEDLAIVAESALSELVSEKRVKKLDIGKNKKLYVNNSPTGNKILTEVITLD